MKNVLFRLLIFASLIFLGMQNEVEVDAMGDIVEEEDDSTFCLKMN